MNQSNILLLNMFINVYKTSKIFTFSIGLSAWSLGQCLAYCL